MSSGIAYPPPTYIPPLPVFNPIFFPQTFGTTSSSGGGGGFTNIFPNGLSSGNVITLNGGTGGGGGTGVERTITGISYLDFVDSASTNPTAITGFITLNGNTLEIGSANNSSGINVNLQGTTLSANGVAIASGGNVSNNINNTFQAPATAQTFDTQSVLIDNSALSFPNGGRILMGNGTSILDFPSTLPISGSGSSGLALAWNQTAGGGQGETDFISYGQGGGGGFSFYSMNSTTTPSLIANMYSSGISFLKNIQSNNTFTGDNYFNTGYINLTNITGSFPSTPVGYSQFVSFNGNPWFSPTNGGGVQLATTTTLLTYAPINSPSFTGTPTAPTPTAGDSSTHLATTSFVASSFAPKNSPALTGIPTAPTATAGNSSTQLATTAFVATSFAPLASPALTGIPTAPTALSTNNSTQIATTAFVQSVVGGAVGPIQTLTSSSSFQDATGGIRWVVIAPAQSATAPYTSPPWGTTFTYKVYTNVPRSSISVSPGGEITLNTNYGIATGSGAYQLIQNAINSSYHYAYVLSNTISNVGTNLDYVLTATQDGSSFFYYMSSTVAYATLAGVDISIDIYPNQ
jgi:hypothetical protein